MTFESRLGALLDYEGPAPAPVDPARIMARARRRTRARRAATGIGALAVAGTVVGFAAGGFTGAAERVAQPGVSAPVTAGAPSPVVALAPGSRHLLSDTGFWTALESSGLCVEGPHQAPLCVDLPPHPGAKPGLGYVQTGGAAVPGHRAVLVGRYTGPTPPTRIVVTVEGRQVVATILTTPGKHNWVTYDAVIPQSAVAHATTVTAFDSTGHVVAQTRGQ